MKVFIINQPGWIRCAVIVFILSVCASVKMRADPENIYRFESREFYHGLFDYGGRHHAAQRDPLLPLTDAEISLLKGEGLENPKPQDGFPYIEYTLKRMGIVRAIGFQKLDEWVPVLIDQALEIRLHKGNLQNLEFNYPCVWALAKIGEPSVDPIMKSFVSSDSFEKRGLLFRALEGIRGKDGAVQLLREQGIDVTGTIEGPTRPSKRGKRDEAVPARGSAIEIKLEKDKGTGLRDSYRDRMVWIVLLSMAAFLIATIRFLNGRRS